MLGIHDMNADNMTKKLEDTMPVIQQVSEQFKNPVCTTENKLSHKVRRLRRMMKNKFQQKKGRKAN